MSEINHTQSNAARVLLITGASRGIGAATARIAGERGYRVCVNYRADREAAEAVVHAITSAGGEAIAVGADIANEAEVARLFKTCDETLGPVWGLVNNAGILEQQLRVDEMDSARLQRVFATNVFGAFACAREAVRRMSTRHGGRGGVVVNVSSVAARLGSPGEYVDYAATKGAIDTFTRGLAAEVAEEGIRVNAVRPGFIYTEMHASGGEPERVDRVKAFIPMKRGGTADETARAILWLLSDEASFTRGASSMSQAEGRQEGIAMEFTLPHGIAVLERTPSTLRAMLAGLGPEWLDAIEGPETWSPYVIVGHMIHGERTDWIPRARLILEQAEDRRFTPYDRFAQFRESEGKSLAELLDEFERLRAANLVTLAGWQLTDQALALEGEHPAFGVVTLRQLLATWVVHDLGHVAQCARVMAKQYRGAIGPWREYLPIVDR